MKDIVISSEVKSEINRLQGELHSICVANHVPMVACTVLGRVENEEGIAINKILSCHLDGPNGAMDTTILAASGVLQHAEIDARIALLIAALGRAENES